MRTREKSKAQLLRELKIQEHRINVLETQKERIKEEYNTAVTDRAKVSDDMFRQAAAHDQVLADHERKLNRVRGELQERHGKVLELEGQVNLLLDQVKSEQAEVAKLKTELQDQMHEVRSRQAQVVRQHEQISELRLRVGELMNQLCQQAVVAGTIGNYAQTGRTESPTRNSY